jgi:ribosomal protein L16 Arg81 hydroxylase
MTFNEFISPFDSIAFFNDYYEKKPLLINRGNPHFYNDLATIDDVEKYLQSDDLNFNSIKVLLNGQSVSPVNYCTASNTSLDSNKLIDYRNKGALIVLNNINKRLKKINDFIAPIQNELQTSFQCNCYLSPANSNGFNTHFDTHDVLVVQFHGKKTWVIYEALDYLPSKISSKDKVTIDDKELKPLMTVELEQGDFLYLPRGFYHKAYTTTQSSGHLAINFSVIFGYKLVSSFGKELHHNNFFKRTFPTVVIDKENYIKEFKEELIAAVQKLTLDDIEKLYQIRLQECRIMNKFEMSKVESESKLVRLYSGEYTIQTDKSICTLKCHQVTMVLPSTFALAISELMKNEKTIVRDILIANEIHQMQLAKRLINEGIFIVEE